MFPLFSSLKNLVRLENIVTDNVVFQLHYKATVLILAACCIAISTRQFLGDPIHCTLPAEEISSKIIDSYCWIHATFTLPGTVGSPIDTHVAHPGVDKLDPGDEVQYHAYYQWVCFVLLLQAAIFYIPRWLWKNWEGGKIVHLMLDLNVPIKKKDEKSTNRNLLSEYLFQTFTYNNAYAFKYFICEFFNFANVIGQIYLVNRFLDGEFTTYGADVISFMETDQEDRIDPMVKVFPRVTKCTFRRFGPSGDIQRHDSLCVLPLNIINEKIYVFLWFWFILIAIMSTLTLLYRLTMIILPGVRLYILHSRVRCVDRDKLSKVLREGSVGDWFLLYMLGKNMEAFNFKQLINNLYTLIMEEIEKKEAEKFV